MCKAPNAYRDRPLRMKLGSNSMKIMQIKKCQRVQVEDQIVLNLHSKIHSYRAVGPRACALCCSGVTDSG